MCIRDRYMGIMKKSTIKVLIIGSASVGKTSLMRQYVQNAFISQYKATIGADFLSKEVISNDKLVMMQIWDTAGQEKFQSVQGVFYKGADACMLVFDLTSPGSFQALPKWKDEFIFHANPSTSSFPFILVGNKVDLADERKVAEAKALQWCKENGNIPYYETSAKTASKVKEAFEELAKRAIANREERT
eukprot:TRINITY_DN1002_c0_g2_i13.p2 TRINITY_DN1002_c0_g2~~TRINITY_DN1002_c0_g2_i13.p2  ORF type:complete len:189 (+),score=60.24 TRINITY_DN1002_c0_g2_i13:73-639(+)